MARSATEIARDTFKSLTQRRLPPTPENYWSTYHEIAGEPDSAPEHALVKAILEAAGDLRPATLKAVEQAITDRNWNQFTELILDVLKQNASESSWTQAWPDLIRELLRQWDARKAGLTSARKQEMLSRVLANFGNDPVQLNEKLAGLARSWSEYSSADAVQDFEAAGAVEKELSDTLEAGADNAKTWFEVKGMVIHALEFALAPRLNGCANLQEEAIALAQQLRVSEWPLQFSWSEAQLRKFWLKLELQAEQEGRLLDGVLNVLHLVIDNLAEVAAEDEWLIGQYAVVQKMFSGPLDMQQVYRAELSIKDLVLKQGALKHSLDDTKIQLKQLITTFIDRLGSLSDSTGAFHGKIKNYSEKIQKANQLGELSTLVDDLMNDTLAMQVDVLRSREEIQQARSQAQAAQEKIQGLEAELQAVSEKVREDELTGALNRRGLDEAFEREMARATRQGTSLCLALLDIDNFKKFNDRLGHQAGDKALQHLVAVVKDTLRPTDVVARYGGEEFVILLPNTKMEEAEQVMERLQRDLTKRFFMHNNERLLITFSAGLTAYLTDDTEATAIARADTAMYRAKKAGKNRVECA